MGLIGWGCISNAEKFKFENRAIVNMNQNRLKFVSRRNSNVRREQMRLLQTHPFVAVHWIIAALIYPDRVSVICPGSETETVL
jgi:hypothetical protein